ncbi:MAG: hypothetical protein RLZZ458_2620 [Planctomycetota bacterium]|jgi:hypothetical protein
MPLLAAAATEFADRTERLWATGFGPEAAAEVLNKVQPDIRAAVQSGEDGFKVHRDLAGLVSARLAASPVKQLQVLVERHKQTAPVAAATRRVRVAGGILELMGPIGPI